MEWRAKMATSSPAFQADLVFIKKTKLIPKSCWYIRLFLQEDRVSIIEEKVLKETCLVNAYEFR